MRSQGMTDGENYRDLLTRLATALAMTEAAYLEARRQGSSTNLKHSVSDYYPPPGARPSTPQAVNKDKRKSRSATLRPFTLLLPSTSL